MTGLDPMVGRSRVTDVVILEQKKSMFIYGIIDVGRLKSTWPLDRS